MNTHNHASESARQIADLQERVSFQEDAITALDQVVARQDQEILALKLQVKSLVGKLKDLQFSMESAGAVGQERPPHY